VRYEEIRDRIDPQKPVLRDWAGCEPGKTVLPVPVNAALVVFVPFVCSGDQYVDIEQIEHD